MKFNKTTLVSLFMALLPVFYHGAEPLIDEYLAIAAQNNPSLKAKYYQYQAAVERIPQAGALPDPQISFGFFPMPMERFSGDQLLDISLMQMFPWFGTLSAAKREAALMAEAKLEEYNDVRSMIFFEIKTAWYNLYVLEREMAIIQDNLKLFQTLEQLSLTRLRSGASSASGNLAKISSTSKDKANNSDMGMPMKMTGEQNNATIAESSAMNMPAMSDMGAMTAGSTMTDTLRLQMEINELRYRLFQLQNRRKPLTARFNQLLNRPPDTEVSVPITLTPSQLPDNVQKIREYIHSQNPMIKMLHQEEKALLAEKSMKQKMGWPMFGIGVQYSIFKARPQNESMMNGKNMIMPMLSVSIPLWRKKYQAAVREVDYKKQSVNEQKQEMLNLLLQEVEQTIADFNDANQRLNLFKQQIALAEQSLNLLTTDYTTSGSNFEDLLRQQQQLLNFRFKMETAAADTLIAAAKFKRLTGE